MLDQSQLNDLADTILQIKTRHEIIEFLHAILTPKELEEIPRRLQIVRKLKKGIPQHTIAQNLGVGVATVTRGANEIKKGRFQNI